MAAGIIIDGIANNVTIDADIQRFIFGSQLAPSALGGFRLDNAVVPIYNSEFSFSTPLPIWVVTKGILVFFKKCKSCFRINLLFAPEATIIIGLLEDSMIETALSISSGSGAGLRTF